MFLEKLGADFRDWSLKNKIGKIPVEVAKEGAGENRIPFAHLANSVPVYLKLTQSLIDSNLNNLKILDVGCGIGRNISFVKSRVNRKNYQYFGIDYSKACINFAKRQYNDFKIKFPNANINENEFILK